MQTSFSVAPVATSFNFPVQSNWTALSGGRFSTASNQAARPQTTRLVTLSPKVATSLTSNNALTPVATAPTTPTAASNQPAKGAKKIQFSAGEIGHAERFADWWGEDSRYDVSQCRWLTWSGTRWDEKCADAVVKGNMMAVARNIVDVEIPMVYASGPYCDEIRKTVKDLTRFADRLHTNAGIAASLELAKTLPNLMVQGEQLDADPMLFNCLSGTVDLKTGLVRPHYRDDYMTNMAPVHLAPPGTPAPRWEQFLDEIMCGDKSMTNYLQKVVGYSLSGDVSRQEFYYLYGTGANGKSRMLSVLSQLLGDYAQHTGKDTFLEKNRGDGPRLDIARLVGKRFVVAGEIGQKAWDTTLIKEVTGADILTARNLFKPFFEFRPVCKLMLAGNTKPDISETSHGIWRRVKLIEFKAKFCGNSIDTQLEEKLLAEGPAILRWAVDGCLKWQKEGLDMPAAVEQATAEYRASMDWMQMFLDEKTITGPGLKAGAQALYDEYRLWCHQSGIKNPKSIMRFSEALKDRGLVKARSGSNNFWRDLGLVASTCPHLVASVGTQATDSNPPQPHRPMVDASGDNMNYRSMTSTLNDRRMLVKDLNFSL